MGTPLANRAGMFTWQPGPLAALCQVLETQNPKPRRWQQQRPCGKHLAQVIAPLGRLAEKVGVEAGKSGGVEVGGWVSGFRMTS